MDWYTELTPKSSSVPCPVEVCSPMRRGGSKFWCSYEATDQFIMIPGLWSVFFLFGKIQPFDHDIGDQPGVSWWKSQPLLPVPGRLTRCPRGAPDATKMGRTWSKSRGFKLLIELNVVYLDWNKEELKHVDTQILFILNNTWAKS